MSADWDRERNSVLRSLGVFPRHYLPEDQAPPVDNDRLRALLRHELTEPEMREVCRLVAAFQSWEHAFTDALHKQSEAASRDVADHSQPMSDTAIEKRLVQIRTYLELDLDEVFDTMSAELASLRGGNPLVPYLPELRRVLCVEWNWPGRRSDPALRDPDVLALAVAEALDSSRIDFPFATDLAAVALVKYGLDRLCRQA